MGTYVHGATALFQLTTPLGPDKLLLRGFRGSEGMSRLFRFELDLLSEDDSITYTDIVGKSVTISLLQASGTPRYFNGVISRFGQGPQDGDFISYHAEMVPWLWFLTRNANCRIFQSKTIPQIITQVFDDQGLNAYDNSLKATYASREYCVQYRETDFNFVSRLMEEYGIYYFFQHENGKHTLVLGDDPNTNADLPGQNEYQLYTESTAVLDEDVIQSFQIEQEMRTGKYSLTDYNFTTPSSNLYASTQTLDQVGGNTAYNTYDYPGKYLTQGDGATLAKVRMEEEESVHLVAHGTSDARAMVSGYKFTLKKHYRDSLNQPYLLTDIDHVGTTSSFGSSRGAQQDHYSNTFRCIPASVPFRPLRVTPHPSITGPQPAVVVGPSGEEIYTDKYGRVKVQFFWDQLGTKDENSSCWIRVSQLFAGKGWGAMFLPRIGQEVLVDFLEGDPDQPVITGRVYNADQTVPGTLPDHMNVSGLRTHSTKGGGDHNANVLAFTDTKGSEVFYMHAEKDMQKKVENNETVVVGSSNSNTSPDGSRTHTVYNNDSLTVTNGNRTVEIKTGNETHTIDQGNETLTVKQGDRLVEVDTGKDTLHVKTGDRIVNVDTGNDTHTVKTGNRSVEVNTGNDDHKIDMGNRSVTVSMGNDSLTVSLGNQSTTISVGSSSTSALQGITLTCGANSIQISPTGITISGMMVSINGQVQTQVSGLMTQVSGSAMLQCSGGITMIG